MTVIDNPIINGPYDELLEKIGAANLFTVFVQPDVAVGTTDDGESFFVRHVHFAGGTQEGGPYERLRRSLEADVDEAAWESLYGTRSRPFTRPASGRVAVTAIDDHGDEVLTVLDVP